MGITSRFKRLTIWNKLSVIGSIAGIFSIPLSLVLFLFSSDPTISAQPDPIAKVIADSRLSSAKATVRGLQARSIKAVRKAAAIYNRKRDNNSTDVLALEVRGCTAQDIRLKRCAVLADSWTTNLPDFKRSVVR